MNYTNEAIDEILSEIKQDKNDKLMFLAAVTKLLGSLELFKNHQYSLVYECKQKSVALKIYELIHESFGFDAELEFSSSDNENCCLIVEGKKANSMLKELGLSYFDNNKYIYDDNSNYVNNLNNKAKVQSYMQGVFISCGSVYFPEGIETDRGYHLEFSFLEEQYALSIKDKLDECGISLSFVARDSSFALYTKSAEKVQDVLAFLKAMNCVIKLSEVNVEREVNNKLNRASNIMASNVDKTMSANIKYISLIERVVKHYGMHNLDEKLARVCKARLEDTQSSMSVLSEKLNMTKSSLNRALKKIEKMAEEILEE